MAVSVETTKRKFEKKCSMACYDFGSARKERKHDIIALLVQYAPP